MKQYYAHLYSRKEVLKEYYYGNAMKMKVIVKVNCEV